MKCKDLRKLDSRFNPKIGNFSIIKQVTNSPITTTIENP